MTLVLIIIGIIVAFSLFDHFSSRSWQNVTSAQRNETVFNDRNKNYGAYQIRKDYDKHLILIVLGLCFGVGGIYAASHVLRELPKQEDKQDKVKYTEVIMELEQKDELPEIENTEEPEAQPETAATLEFREPIVDDQEPEGSVTILKPTDPVGPYTDPGDGGFGAGPQGPKDGDGTGTKPIEIKKPTEPLTFVDEQATFPGGINAMRKFIVENIDTRNIDGFGKVYLRFVVDLDGSISSISVTNKDKLDCIGCADAAVKVVKAMPKWSPGKLNGEEVKSYFTMPINIKGE